MVQTNSTCSYSEARTGEWSGVTRVLGMWSGRSCGWSIEYTLADSQGATDTAIVTVTVTGLNDDPTVSGTIPDQNNLDSQTIAPLDVTHQVMVTPEALERIRQLDSDPARNTAGMLDYFNRHDIEKYKGTGAPLHDPCTIAWLLKPELFEDQSVPVAVETEGAHTMGATVVDWWGVTGEPPNTRWITQADGEGVLDLLIERIGRL